jgi:hypothetical protein
MRTLYCKSEASFLDLLRPMFSELDSLYWVVACQTGPVRTDWIFESPEHERILEQFHVSVPAFESRGLSLWRPGALFQFDGHLEFDEWSYFVGFQASESEAIGRGTRLGLSRFFSPEFYELLTREGQLFAVHVDGWWEFCPATDALFARVRDCAPCREIALRIAGAVDWTPQFV